MHPLFWVGVAGDMLMDGKSMTKVLKTVLQKVLGGGQTVRLSDSHWHRLELQHASTKQYKPHHPSQWTVAHKCFPNVSQNLASNPDTTSFIACSFELSFACA